MWDKSLIEKLISLGREKNIEVHKIDSHHWIHIENPSGLKKLLSNALNSK